MGQFFFYSELSLTHTHTHTHTNLESNYTEYSSSSSNSNSGGSVTTITTIIVILLNRTPAHVNMDSISVLTHMPKLRVSNHSHIPQKLNLSPH